MAAGEYTENTSQHLHEILSREEFQPRGNEPTWYNKLWDRFGDYLLEKIGDVLEQLKGWDIHPDRDFWLLRWLMEWGDWFAALFEYLLVFFRYLGYTLALAVFAALAYFLYRHLGGGAPSAADARREKKQRASETQDTTSPLEYLANGDLGLALIQMRALLRRFCGEQYAVSSSLTDAELRMKLTGESGVTQLFDEVSKAFERVFYAGTSVEDKEVRRLCQMFSELEKRGEV